MNSEPEDFDALKKLLSIKRHEQPPPGYFHELPRKIWSRIEAEEQKPSFWKRFLPDLALKPSVAYAFGLVVCGTLIVGIGSTLQTDEPATASMPGGLGQQESMQILPASVGFAQESTPLPGTPGGFSTNPLFAPQPFQPGGIGIEVEPASYSPNGAKP